MLAAAFGRALRDPFVHARNAALLALAATIDVFDETDCAVRLLPGIAPSLVDKEKCVLGVPYGCYVAEIADLLLPHP